jgi:hypothetical protein
MLVSFFPFFGALDVALHANAIRTEPGEVGVPSSQVGHMGTPIRGGIEDRHIRGMAHGGLAKGGRPQRRDGGPPYLT